MAKPLILLVEPDGIEPTTFSMPLKPSSGFRSSHVALSYPVYLLFKLLF